MVNLRVSPQRRIQCNFSSASGILTAHTVDVDFGGLIASTAVHAKVYAFNTTLAAATKARFLTYADPRCELRAQRIGGVAGTHATYRPMGTITIDTTIFKTASPAQRLTPSSASVKLESAVKRLAVVSGATATVNAWVRKSVIGDGAAYNGNQPRLICKKNLGAGITADTVLDTAAVAAGTWEQLSAATPAITDDAVLEIVVDCDGTAGWIDADDWSVS